jgi:hypothetical protein
MPSKEQIIAGLQMTVENGKRTTAHFADGEWDAKRASGWTPKETYAHLAAVATMVPTLGQSLVAAPEDVDVAQGIDIHMMNAQSVAPSASMTPEQIMKGFEDAYGKLIEFVKALPDDQMGLKRRFISDSVPVSDILATSVVLHGLHHVYEASSRLDAPF